MKLSQEQKRNTDIRKPVSLSLHISESKNQPVGRSLADSKEVSKLTDPVAGKRESQQALGW